MSYFDERETAVPEDGPDTAYIPTAIAHKVILLSGISLRVAEIPVQPVFNYFQGTSRRRLGADAELIYKYF